MNTLIMPVSVFRKLFCNFCKFILLLLLILVCQPKEVKSQNCTGCTYTVSTNSSTNYTLTSGQKLCITSTGTVTGTIILNGASICSQGNFTPGAFTYTQGNFDNYGSATFGNISFSNSSITLTNYLGATLTINGTYTASNPGASFINNGTATVTGAFSQSSGTLTNNGILTLNSTASSGGAFTNNGTITSHGFTTTGGTFSNSVTGNIANIGNFINSGGSNSNSGTITSTGNFTSSTTFTNSGGLITCVNFINYSTFTLSGGSITSTNFTNSGTINGPGSGAGCGAISATTTTTNSGSINGYADICDATPPSGSVKIDNNTGTVASTVSYCVCCVLNSATISGATPICSGSSTTLTASTGLTYSWSTTATTQAITVNPTTTTTYTVTITYANACTKTVTKTVVIGTPTTPYGDWTGTANTDWFNCLNWKGYVVPTSSTDVTIKNGAVNMPVISVAGAVCRNLTIESSATLTINNSASTLTIYGNYLNSNSVTGSLSHTAGTITFGGASAQTINTGSGATSNSFYNLTIDNSSGGVSLLSNPATVTGALTLTNGVLTTTSANLLTLTNGATSSSGSINSYISGPVKKIGNSAFSFAIGKSGHFNPISITAPSSTTDAFQVEFFNADPTNLYGTLTDSTFNYISKCQYYDLQRINGTSNIQPTLSFDATSCISNLLPNPRIIGYNGSKWQDLGISNLNFAFTGGTVSSAGPISVYGPITLGNYDPLVTDPIRGDTCYTAIVMPDSVNSVLTGATQTKDEKWFTFIPKTPEIRITLTNTSMASNHIKAITLMEGICVKYFLAAFDSSITDTVLTITLHEAIVGVPYFITTLTTCPTCTGTPASFDLQVENLLPPIQTETNNIIYLNGVPSHVKEQVIIRVDKKHLKMGNVDNTSILDGVASTFFDSITTGDIAYWLYTGDTSLVNSLYVKKVFPEMTSADTTALSRDSLTIRVPDFFEIFILSLPNNNKLFFTSRLLSTISKYSEPNFVFTETSVPNDDFYANSQASIHPTTTYPNAHINIEDAWDTETGKSFVKVGVYDSGIDQTHDDLIGKVVGGYDYFSNTSIILGTNNDVLGHGTSCAGIIGALRNNSEGIAGIAGGDVSSSNNGVSLYDYRILGPSGNLATESNVAASIKQGAQNGLHIMSNSWGSPAFSNLIHDAVQFAVRSGVVFVVSRGNFPNPFQTKIDNPMYPSCFQDEMVINVGASGTDGKWKTTTNGNSMDANDMAYSSMTKNGVDVIAPGTNAVVYTTQHNTNTYHGFNGTSAACPHVSGVAALILSHVDQTTASPNNLTVEDVEHILQMSANNKQSGASVYDNNNGWGLLDASAALNKIKKPVYKIQHFGINQNVTSSSVTKTKIETRKLIILPTPYGILASAPYLADIYLCTTTLNYNLSNSNDVILDSWPRFSSTLGWRMTNPINYDNWCKVVSVNATQAVLQNYIYDIVADAQGRAIDPVYPTQNPYASISIYTMDPTMVGIEQINIASSLGIYPNPAHNNANVNIKLSEAQQISVELFNTQGKKVKNIFRGKVTEGNQQFQITLSDVSAGVYYVRLITDKSITSKKLVIVK